MITPAVEHATNDLVFYCHKAARDGGWWTNERGFDLTPPMVDRTRFGLSLIAEKLALIHSEVSEALEGVRKDKMDDHLPHHKSMTVELADAIIRICDLAGALQLPLGQALLEKMEYNAVRQDHKPEARAAAGGKAF